MRNDWVFNGDGALPCWYNLDWFYKIEVIKDTREINMVYVVGYYDQDNTSYKIFKIVWKDNYAESINLAEEWMKEFILGNFN